MLSPLTLKKKSTGDEIGFVGIYFSIFSTADIGEPAATLPTIGMPEYSSTNLSPLDESGTFTRTPFFTRAFMCDSAAFTDLKPIIFAISALVGG